MSAVQAEWVSEVGFARSRAHASEVEGTIAGAEMVRKPHSDVEDFLDAKGREWARLMCEEHLALRGQLERRTEVVGAEGTPRKSARDSGRHLQTLVGRVAVPRLAYQAPGASDLGAVPRSVMGNHSKIDQLRVRLEERGPFAADIRLRDTEIEPKGSPDGHDYRAGAA